MPNAKILSEKQAIVEGLTKRINDSMVGVFIDYKGITVAEDTELRRKLVENSVEYNVIKNTLAKFAVEKVGLNDILPILNGTTSLATSNADPIAPLNIISKQAKDMDSKFNIKAAYMEGRVLSDAEIEEMSKFTSKDSLVSVVLGTMLAPITSLAVVLGQILEQAGGSMEPAAAEAAE